MRSTFASFVVDKRIPLVVAMLVLTVACGIMFPFVGINSDMTKYLPDSSSMKQGVDLMDSEFTEDQPAQYVRVMFTGMPASEEEATCKALEAIPNVDHVAWEANSPDYHNGDKTLFEVYTTAGYRTAEEKAIEQAIATDFDYYGMVYKNGDNVGTTIQWYIIAAALLLIFVVLFIMCGSWIEPVLFLATVGCAVLMNMGTNLVQGEISDMTFTIGALLQLVLSIDYSVILMNRYRQELAAAGEGESHADAMKRALAAALPSIASSALTTIVGLLALVFMDFKLGADIGIVLAKGIAFSLLCVVLMLPGVILVFDKLVQKTAKPVPHLRMRTAGRIAFAARYPIMVVFLACLVGFYLAQSHTSVSYTLANEDEISDAFPETNTVVMLYDNADEADVARVQDAFANDSRVKSISAFSTTLGKPYTADQLVSEVQDLAGSSYDTSAFNAETVRMLYYDTYGDPNSVSMTVPQFITFLQDDVLSNETFADTISEQDRSNVNQLDKFKRPEDLTMQRNAASLADFLGLAVQDVKDMLLLYGIDTWAWTPEGMTLPTFVDFALEMADDPTYGSMMDDSMRDQLEQMRIYTEEWAMTRQRTAADSAAFLGMDESQMQMVYLMYYQQAGATAADTMTVEQLVAFLSSPQVAQNPQFAAYMTGVTPEQLQQLVQYAQMTGMTQPLTAAEMAEFAQMDVQAVTYLYGYNHLINGDTSAWTLSIQELLSYLCSGASGLQGQISEGELAQLSQALSIINASLDGTWFTYAGLADFLGMDYSDAYTLFLLRTSRYGNTSSWTLSVQQFLNYLVGSVLTNADYADAFTAEDADSLRAGNTLVNAVVAGESYSAEGMADLLSSVSSATESASSFSLDQMNLLYLFYGSKTSSNPAWTMTLLDFVDKMGAVAIDPRFASFLDSSQRADIATMQQEVNDGKKLLVGPNYSLMSIVVNAPAGSDVCTQFLNDFTDWCNNNMGGDRHLIGTSAMAFEMMQTFGGQMTLITMLSAIAIFLVVLLTFRNLLIPLILVAIVECGVYATITCTGLQGYSIYYLALVVVQCILMGATVDYGILFCNNYREQRLTQPVKESLVGAYANSINTVLTSGVILVAVCAVVGRMFSNPTIGQICTTISLGAFCTIVLIVLFLPGILAALDRLVGGRGRLQQGSMLQHEE
ncbi:MAG: efflux RND transporter permease subunit [Coriobacteriia bacterium]|nr:efflux RND transporter permease subunit [Coriobacteriia bacterium]